MSASLKPHFVELNPGVSIAFAADEPPAAIAGRAVSADPRSASGRVLAILPARVPLDDELLDEWLALGNVQLWAPPKGLSLQELSDTLAVLRSESRTTLLGPLHALESDLIRLRGQVPNAPATRPGERAPVVVTLGFETGWLATALIEGLALASVFAVDAQLTLRSLVSAGDARLLAILEASGPGMAIQEIHIELTAGDSERTVTWDQARFIASDAFTGGMERKAIDDAADFMLHGPEATLSSLPATALTTTLAAHVASIAATLRLRSVPIAGRELFDDWRSPDRVRAGHRLAAHYDRRRQFTAAATVYEELTMEYQVAEFALAAAWHLLVADNLPRAVKLLTRPAGGYATRALQRELARLRLRSDTAHSRTGGSPPSTGTYHFFQTSDSTRKHAIGARLAVGFGDSSDVYPHEIQTQVDDWRVSLELEFSADHKALMINIQSVNSGPRGPALEILFYRSLADDPESPGEFLDSTLVSPGASHVELDVAGADASRTQSLSFVLELRSGRHSRLWPLRVHPSLGLPRA